MVLVVGGHRWARAIALALRDAGLAVRLWTGRADEQAAARTEGLDARNARLGVDLASREAELDDITDALLLTASDDFNALAAFELRQDLGHDHVYRLAPGSDLLDLVPGYAEGRTLFAPELTFDELAARFDSGAQLATGPGDDSQGPPADAKMLFLVSNTGALQVITPSWTGRVGPDDQVIWLAARSSRDC